MPRQLDLLLGEAEEVLERLRERQVRLEPLARHPELVRVDDEAAGPLRLDREPDRTGRNRVRERLIAIVDGNHHRYRITCAI